MVDTEINGRWTLKLPDFRAERVEWSDPGWERERLDSMHANIHADDVVYDVGTEEGDLSALYALWGAQLVLIEPNEAVWPCTKAIWEANDLAAPLAWFRGFAADSTTAKGFVSHPEDATVGHYEYGHFGWPPCADGPLVRAHGFSSLYDASTATITLDTLAKSVGWPPDAITIDVEGSELRVLRGAERLLLEHQPLVWVSTHPVEMDRYDDDEADLLIFMSDCGYRFTHLATDHEEHWMFTP